MNVLLDTTVLIDVLRGRPAGDRLLALRASGDTPWTTAVNVEEIYRGLLARERSAVDGLVRGLRVIPLAATEGVRAGMWRREFATRGVTLSQADCLIAAAAVTLDAMLATGNPKDFPMKEVVVKHWPVGD